MDGQEPEADTPPPQPGNWVFVGPQHVPDDDHRALDEVSVGFQSGESYGDSDGHSGESGDELGPRRTAFGLDSGPTSALFEREQVSAAALAGVSLDTGFRPHALDATALRLPADHRQVRAVAPEETKPGAGAPAGPDPHPLPRPDIGPPVEPDLSSAEALLESLTSADAHTLDTRENRQAAYTAAKLAHKVLQEQHQRFTFVQMAAGKVLAQQWSSVHPGENPVIDRPSLPAPEPFQLPANSPLLATLTELSSVLRRIRVMQRQQSSLLHELAEYEQSLRTETESQPTGAPTPQPIPHDGALGRVKEWDAVLVLRQWHQAKVRDWRFFWRSNVRLQACLKHWRDDLQDWVSRAQSLAKQSAGHAIVKAGLTEDTESFVEHLNRLSTLSLTEYDLRLTERQCRLFVLRWRVEAALMAFQTEIVQEYHPLRFSGGSHLAQRALASARTDLYPSPRPPGDVAEPKPAAASGLRRRKPEATPRTAIAPAEETEEQDDFDLEWRGAPKRRADAQWVTDVCDAEATEAFVSRDLRVRMMLVTWTLEQLAGQGFIKFSVRRVPGTAVNGHTCKVGDIVVLVRAMEAGLAHTAVDAGYKLQVLEAVRSSQFQPQAPFMELDTSVDWTEKWLMRPTIKIGDDDKDDLEVITGGRETLLWWTEPHTGPYAQYSRAKVYDGMWRRFMVENHHKWEKSLRQDRIAGGKNLSASLRTLVDNLERRTPESVFFPMDRPRLLYRLLRSVMWIDGDAPSFNERSHYNVKPGGGADGSVVPDITNSYLGPDLFFVHDRHALESIEAHWDDVKDRMFQSVFEEEGAAERRFTMSLRSYFGEQIASYELLAREAFKVLAAAVLFTLFVRYIGIQAILSAATCSEDQTSRLYGLGFGFVFMFLYLQYLFTSWERLKHKLKLWWGLPKVWKGSDLAHNAPEQYVVRRSWDYLHSWYSRKRATLKRWGMVFVLLVLQLTPFGLMAGFTSDNVFYADTFFTNETFNATYSTGTFTNVTSADNVTFTETTESLAFEEVSVLTMSFTGVVVMAVVQTVLNMAGRYKFKRWLAQPTVPITQYSRNQPRQFMLDIKQTSSREWRRFGAPVLSTESLHDHTPVIDGHHALEGRGVMYHTGDETQDVLLWFVYLFVSHFATGLWLAIGEEPVNCTRLCLNRDCFQGAGFHVLIMNWLLVISELIFISWRNRWRYKGRFSCCAPWRSNVRLGTAMWPVGFAKWELARSVASKPKHMNTSEVKASADRNDSEMDNPEYKFAAQGDGATLALNAAFKNRRNAQRQLAAVGALSQVLGLQQSDANLAAVDVSGRGGLKGGSGRRNPRPAGQRRSGQRRPKSSSRRRSTGESKSAPAAGGGEVGGEPSPLGETKDTTAMYKPDKTLVTGLPAEMRAAAALLPLQHREPYEDAQFFATVLFIIATALLSAALDPSFVVAGTLYLFYLDDAYLARLVLGSVRPYPHRMRSDRWTAGVVGVTVLVCLLYGAMLATADIINIVPSRCSYRVTASCPATQTNTITTNVFSGNITVTNSTTEDILNALPVDVGSFTGWELADFILFTFGVGAVLAGIVLGVGSSSASVYCGGCLRARNRFKEIDEAKELSRRNEDAVNKLFYTAQRTSLLQAEYEKDGTAKAPVS